MGESTYSTLKKMRRKSRQFHIDVLNQTNLKRIQKKNKQSNINVNNKIIQRKKDKMINTRIDLLHHLLKKIQKPEWLGKYCNNRNVSKITILLSQLKIDLKLLFLINSRNQSLINNLVYHTSLNILPVYPSTPICKKMMSLLNNQIVLQFL